MPSASKPLRVESLNGRAQLALLDFEHLSAVSDDALLAQLRRFSEQALNAFARKTHLAWHHDSQVFSAWCATHHRRALPASPQTIAEFLQDMALPIEHDGYGRATSTVARYAATLSWMHRAAGLAENPCEDTKVVLALRAIRRTYTVARAQKDPLTWEIIASALSGPRKHLRDHFDAALACIGYDAMCRSEDLRNMHIEHVTFDDAGTGTIYIARGKTDQIGEGWEGFLSATTVASLRTWIATARISRGYLFRPVDNAGVVGLDDQPLSEAAVTRAFKRIAARGGADPSNVAGHSARIGACHDLTAAGFALPQVMQAGRWSSPDMPAHYSRKLAAKRGPMAELAVIQKR